MRRLSRRRSERSETGTYLIDGPVLLGEALAAGVGLRAVFVEPKAHGHPVVEAARQAGAEVREVLDGTLSRVLDLVAPQAVVAVAVQRRHTLDEVLVDAASRRRPVLVPVSLQDPGNAGTLVRVAEAAGCAGVVLTSGSVDVHNPKTVRATAGSVFRLPVVEGVSAPEVILAATRHGIRSWATTGDAGADPGMVDLAGASLVLVGSEAHGLPVDVVDRVDGRLSIPMEGAVESLNAGVAGALVVFEAARQRRAADRPTAAPNPGSRQAPPGAP